MSGVRPSKVRLLLAGLAGLCLWVAVSPPSHSSANLAPNPAFEASVAEPVEALEGQMPQPVAPVGWVAEGSGAFTYAADGGRGGSRHVAVVGQASPSPDACAGSACTSPLELVKGEADRALTINPHWRSVPVPVTGNATYTFSVWTSWEGATPGAGVQTRLRWLNDFGVPIRADAGPGRSATAADAASLGWTQLTRSLTAPPMAKSVVILLGSRSSLGTSRLAFDDVHLARS